MQFKQWAALSAVAFATGAVMAAEGADASAALTRAQVAQSVLQARAAGQLRPAGDAADFQRAPTLAAATVSRDQVRRDVIAARASGALEPAGEAAGFAPDRLAYTTASVVTRADVKAQTLRARADGELAPAGEGVDGTVSARNVRATPRNGQPLAQLSHADAGSGQTR